MIDKCVPRVLCAASAALAWTVCSALPSAEEFGNPGRENRPETWFHLIGGNVSEEGLTADLEAIAAAGISGIQFFHGQFGGEWPGVKKQIPCLSADWDSMIAHVADECRRLGLTLKLQNCPGWSMSGGPWVKPEDAMRRLVYGRADAAVGPDGKVSLALPRAERVKFGHCKTEKDIDYRDICVLAFPTPEGDTGEELRAAVTNAAGTEVVYSFAEPVTVRSVEVQPFGDLDFRNIYVPDMRISIEARNADGTWTVVADEDHPQSNWMYGWHESPWFSVACDDAVSDSWRVTVKKRATTRMPKFRLFSAARPDNWDSLAGWQYAALVRRRPQRQSKAAYVRSADVRDVSASMSSDGSFAWKAPKPGKWTFLRIGHVNLGTRNAPAPKEATGWECTKLERRGAEVNFAGYVGRLVNGPLKGKSVKGVVIDSWECGRQSWSDTIESDFRKSAGYGLRLKLPAVFGWVLDDVPSTEVFLRDWRKAIGGLVEENYYRRMAELCRENGLEIQYETAFGDVIHGDLLRFWKHADTPMCEFWHRHENFDFVGTYNFKPVQPCISSAHVYGKRRVAAEALTSFDLTWNEDFRLLKRVVDKHFARGVSHLVFHTYTHNPVTEGVCAPGSSFGCKLGTPFLRNQTWWKHMPRFTAYAARVGMMLESGLPCVDVLWMLGEEFGHKPDQDFPFPRGYRYDYVNADALKTRLGAVDGLLRFRDGMTSKVLWIPDGTFLEPDTARRVTALEEKGAKVVRGGVRDLEEALAAMRAGPDVRFAPADAVAGFDDFMWCHRVDGDRDIYFVATARKGGVKGEVTFRSTGKAEIRDPVSGGCRDARVTDRRGMFTTVAVDLADAGSVFVVFDRSVPGQPVAKRASAAGPETVVEIVSPWRVEFPGFGGDARHTVMKKLLPWKDAFDDTPEGREARAFSGTAKYVTTFRFDRSVAAGRRTMLCLGRVEAWAKVRVNGMDAGTLWCEPYSVDVTDLVRDGENDLEVEVTGTWYNRLVYDASLPEAERKTWTIAGPKAGSPYLDSGLIGPVALKCVPLDR